MNKHLYTLLFLTLLLNACQTSHYTAEGFIELYQSAIEEAMSPAPDKIYSNLIPINSSNSNLIRKEISNEMYILVVTWKNDTSYYKPNSEGFYNTGNYPIWITTAPELLKRMQQEKSDDINLRLKQLLGLPPNSVYNYFIEFWVKPEDLYRPCPDNEISDSSCELCFPSQTKEAYKTWVNDNRINRYYNCELYNKYPWKQLGYTYDWNPKNKTHVGLSEFVIGKNKNLVINKIYTTEEYLNKQ